MSRPGPAIEHSRQAGHVCPARVQRGQATAWRSLPAKWGVHVARSSSGVVGLTQERQEMAGTLARELS
jgi:hypothetical protein